VCVCVCGCVCCVCVCMCCVCVCVWVCVYFVWCVCVWCCLYVLVYVCVCICVCVCVCMCMCMCVCVCAWFFSWSSSPNITIQERHKFEDNLNVISDSPLLNYKYMEDMLICETLATQTSLNLVINNDDYGPWNNMHCVQWCMFEVQSEGNVIVQLSVLGFVLVCECQ